jgi:hypothetical protein
VVTVLAFGGGLGLLPGDVPPPPDPGSRSGGVVDAPAPPQPARPASPAVPLAAVGLAGVILAQSNRRGRDAGSDLSPGAALGLRPPPDLRVVFVPGYGDPHASTVFRRFVEMAGIDPANARYFDYRWGSPIDDHRMAARLVSVDFAARSLNSFIAGVAADGHPVYVIGFSKGGATVAHLVAAWDRGLQGPGDSVVGAALLDPPIASGPMGWLQSAGRMWSGIPDDGGYDPIRCGFLRLVCTDTRIGLGRPSGVEVIVIQNPKAAITNVVTPPPGLRVVDIPDDGPGVLEQIRRNPVALPSRISEAHTSVLRNPRVAECIVAEMWSPASCGLAPSSAGRSRGARLPLSMRVL